MSEPAQALLRRELAEFNAGERDLWSARALHRAARITSRMAHRWQRCQALALEITGTEPEQLTDITDPIRQLESRAWLLNFMWTLLAEEDATGVPIDL
jgi:truncated hemoglobin YjbI